MSATMDKRTALTRRLTFPWACHPRPSKRERRNSAPTVAQSTTVQPARIVPASQIPNAGARNRSAPIIHIVTPRSRPSTTGPVTSTTHQEANSTPASEVSPNHFREDELLPRATTRQQQRCAAIGPTIRIVSDETVPSAPPSPSRSSHHHTHMQWLGTPPSLPKVPLYHHPKPSEVLPYSRLANSTLIHLQAATIQILINDSFAPPTSPQIGHLAMLLVGYTETHNLLLGYSSISRAFACTFFAAATLGAEFGFSERLGELGLEFEPESMATALFALFQQRDRVKCLVEFFGGSVDRSHLLQTRGPCEAAWRVMEDMEGHHRRVELKRADLRAEAVWKELCAVEEWRVEEGMRVARERVVREWWEERGRGFEERKGRGSPLRGVVWGGEDA